MRYAVIIIILVWLACYSTPVLAENGELTAEEMLNKDLIEWVFEQGVNKQNPNAWDTVLAPDYIRHCDAMPPGMRELVGLEKMKQFLTEHFAAFPDWDEQIKQMVIQGDKIAIVSIGTGTMTGGFGPFEATGQKVKITDIAIHRFENGKFVESWITWDNINFMMQAGLMPPSSTPKPDSDEN